MEKFLNMPTDQVTPQEVLDALRSYQQQTPGMIQRGEYGELSGRAAGLANLIDRYQTAGRTSFALMTTLPRFSRRLESMAELTKRGKPYEHFERSHEQLLEEFLPIIDALDAILSEDFLAAV